MEDWHSDSQAKEDAYFLIPSERGCSPFLIPSERGCYNLSDAKCFPQRSFFPHQSFVSPTKSCLPQWISSRKTFVFPSGVPFTPQCCHVSSSSYAFIKHCIAF